MINIKNPIILVSIILCSAIPFKLVFNNDLSTLENSIEKSDTKVIYTIYNDLTNIEKEEGRKVILKYMNNLEEEVSIGAEDPKEAIGKINDISQISEVKEEVIKVRNNILDIEESQISFNKAERAKEEGDYKKALDNYNNVIKEDKKNYEESRKKIKEIKDYLEN